MYNDAIGVLDIYYQLAAKNLSGVKGVGGSDIGDIVCS
jgi:hypothetical protein